MSNVIAVVIEAVDVVVLMLSLANDASKTVVSSLVSFDSSDSLLFH
jgi:hypothetical protein